MRLYSADQAFRSSVVGCQPVPFVRIDIESGIMWDRWDEGSLVSSLVPSTDGQWSEVAIAASTAIATAATTGAATAITTARSPSPPSLSVSPPLHHQLRARTPSAMDRTSTDEPPAADTGGGASQRPPMWRMVTISRRSMPLQPAQLLCRSYKSSPTPWTRPGRRGGCVGARGHAMVLSALGRVYTFALPVCAGEFFSVCTRDWSP